MGIIQSPPSQRAPVQGNGFVAELSLDLLNSIFHEIWRTGVFNSAIPIPAELSGFVSQASIQSFLPPVIVPARNDQSGLLLLQIGALIIDLQLSDDLPSDSYLLTIESELNLGLDQGAFTFDLSENPSINVHLLANRSQQALNSSLLELVITTSVWSELRNSLTNGIDFALGTFDVDASALSAFSEQIQSLAIQVNFDPQFTLRNHDLFAVGALDMLLTLIPALE